MFQMKLCYPITLTDTREKQIKMLFNHSDTREKQIMFVLDLIWSVTYNYTFCGKCFSSVCHYPQSHYSRYPQN